MNRELPLTLVALVAAAITPNVFVAGGLQLMSASLLAKYVLLPAIVVQLAILFYARGAGHPRLVNRLVTGVWVGFVATTGLDIVRQPGTFFGYLQHDEARMAGEMILGGGHGDATAQPHGDGETRAARPHGEGEKQASAPASEHGRIPATARGPSQAAGRTEAKPAHGAPAAGHAPMTRGGEAPHVGAEDC